ncbi:MAG TPA: hypothetical protein VN766_00215 [Stellaceae bacterium]|jgi:TRAP-type uncharacterized transport system fused permease subunit|nr:hypothetical protein [Stellaceae bacterium]
MSGPLMRLGSQTLAAILGGPGIFYVWYSFYAPWAAANAVILLGCAIGISVFLYPELQGSPQSALRLIRRIAGHVARLTGRL